MPDRDRTNVAAVGPVSVETSQRTRERRPRFRFDQAEPQSSSHVTTAAWATIRQSGPKPDQLGRSACARSSATSVALCSHITFAPAACCSIERLSVGTELCRQRAIHHRKSSPSRDRLSTRQAHRYAGKSKTMIVSAACRRRSTTSFGPRSPSRIHFSPATSFSWTTCQTAVGVVRPSRRQYTLSSSTTGRSSISPSRCANVLLPAPPLPKITTRRMIGCSRTRGCEAQPSAGAGPRNARDLDDVADVARGFCVEPAGSEQQRRWHSRSGATKRRRVPVPLSVADVRLGFVPEAMTPFATGVLEVSPAAEI